MNLYHAILEERGQVKDLAVSATTLRAALDRAAKLVQIESSPSHPVRVTVVGPTGRERSVTIWTHNEQKPLSNPL